MKTGSTALFQPYISPTCYTENGEREAVEDLKGHVPPPKERSLEPALIRY